MARRTKAEIRDQVVRSVRDHTREVMVSTGQATVLHSPGRGRFEFNAVTEEAAEVCVDRLERLFTGSVGLGRCRFTRRGTTVKAVVFISKIHW